MKEVLVNHIDYLIFAIMGLSSLLGFFYGFISSVLSAICWCLSIYLSYTATPNLWHVDLNLDSPFRTIVAPYLGVFSLSLGAFSFARMLLIKALIKVMSPGRVSPFDRSLGLLLGIMRGTLIVGICHLSFVMVNNIMNDNKSITEVVEEKQPELLKSSYCYSFILQCHGVMMMLLPPDFDSTLTSRLGVLRDHLDGRESKL